MVPRVTTLSARKKRRQMQVRLPCCVAVTSFTTPPRNVQVASLVAATPLI